MDTAVMEKSRAKTPDLFLRPATQTKKKSFEEAVAECNGISVDEFFDELRKRVKERYRNAKN